MIQERKDMQAQNTQEQERWSQEAEAERMLSIKREYAPLFVLDAQEWKRERENKIKERMWGEINDVLGKNNEYFNSETDKIA